MSSLAKNDNAEHCKSILSTMLRQEVHYNKSPYLATTKKRGGAAPDVACRAKVCRVSNALHVVVYHLIMMHILTYFSFLYIPTNTVDV